jgi:acetate kinase
MWLALPPWRAFTPKGSRDSDRKRAKTVKVLILNCGSSSIKYQLYDAITQKVEAKGLVSRIGAEGSQIDTQTRDLQRSREVDIPGHGRGLELIVESLLDPQTGVIGDVPEVSAVGHRVVHGGSYFSAPALLTPDVIEKIEACAPLAPLHNPPILLGIRESLRILPDSPQVAVFDTAFHATSTALMACDVTASMGFPSSR